MKKKRKLKLKKKSIFLLIVIILGIFLIIVDKNINLSSDKKEETKRIDYVASILENATDDLFEEEFLKWIAKEYDIDVLKQLNKSLKENAYDTKLWHQLTGNSYLVLQDLYHNNYQNRNDITVVEGKKEEVTISYAGDVSLADNWDIMPYYNSRKEGILGILSEDMVNYMKKSDWMVVNSEFAFSDRGSAMNGKLYTFRGHPDNVSIYKEMGVDMVTLANNHVYDYGSDAFLDTLTTLENASIPYVGAGRNISDATKTYYLVINGYKIAFLNATRAEKYILTPEANDISGGVFRCYDPTLFVSKIQEAREVSDYVVALVHWGRENTHELEDVQKETGKLYIDSGADMVIGSHAHVLRGVEFYKDKLIAYNLGNFIFNDYTIDTGILTWKIKDDGNSEFYFYPGIQKSCYTSNVEGEEKRKLLNKMTEWSINATFLEDGKIVQK